MKIIVSHDVDHIYWKDHLTDRYLMGVVFRSSKEYLKGHIPWEVFVKRISWRHQLNNLDTLLTKLIRLEIPATFFFATRKGLNLSYSAKNAQPYIEKIKDAGFDIGLHGMSFLDYESMKEEKLLIENILGNPVAGIRNHYLRTNDKTKDLMDRLGYNYDTTEYGLTPPYRIGNLWEFPISIMDVTAIQSLAVPTFENLQKLSLEVIEAAFNEQLPYFVINFHDVYYTESYPVLKKWFDWIIEEFFKLGTEFVSFKTALLELEPFTRA